MAISKSCIICGQGCPQFDSQVYLYAGRRSNVLACATCGSFYLASPISDEDIAACYPPTYHEDFGKSLNKNFVKGVLIGRRLRRWKIQGEFLDVGCGIGGIVAGVVQGSGWVGVGTEITAEAVRMAKDLFPQVQFFRGGLNELPNSKARFDSIYVNNVLEHTRDPEAFLVHVYSLLKPGGRVELFVPNGPVDISPNRLLFKEKKAVLLTKHGGHLFFFSRRGLELLFSRVGFSVRSWRSFHFVQALKATGYIPGKIHQFERKHTQREPSATNHPASAAPPISHKTFDRPGVIPFRLKAVGDILRAPFRYITNFGYDYEIVLEKPEV